VERGEKEYLQKGRLNSARFRKWQEEFQIFPLLPFVVLFKWQFVSINGYFCCRFLFMLEYVTRLPQILFRVKIDFLPLKSIFSRINLQKVSLLKKMLKKRAYNVVSFFKSFFLYFLWWVRLVKSTEIFCLRLANSDLFLQSPQMWISYSHNSSVFFFIRKAQRVINIYKWFYVFWIIFSALDTIRNKRGKMEKLNFYAYFPFYY
jgi:hypothetical protein